jgi:tRNA uracil 4-sulfurtransferase
VKEALLIRYGEIGLKGGNRPLFERALAQNLRTMLADAPDLRILRLRGRMLLTSSVPAAELALDAQKVFGITSVSPATEVAPEPEAIYAAALKCTQDALQTDYGGTFSTEFDGKMTAGTADPVRFRVTINRAHKGFPINSNDFAPLVAAAVLPQVENVVVDLSNPQLELEVDIRQEGTWVFARRLPGPGGLPAGTMGRVHCLLSGGIDSPVAAWLCMKRGMRVEFVSFYSFPYVGPQSREKIIQLAGKLSEWQANTVLHMVPFADYQTAIRDHCPEPYRTVLYRRAMQRIASRIAQRRKGKALVTGESVGQVASQTLENMRIIEEASYFPVLRPLVTCDKTEAVAMARKIGTYELSTLPAPDCCTVFQPESPIIYGRIADAIQAESALDLDTLTGEALKGTERIHFPDQDA